MVSFLYYLDPVFLCIPYPYLIATDNIPLKINSAFIKHKNVLYPWFRSKSFIIFKLQNIVRGIQHWDKVELITVDLFGFFLENIIITASDKIIKILEKSTIKREKSQTLREYLKSIFNNLHNKECEEFVNIFETARYSNNSIGEEWRSKIWRIWHKIIRGIPNK